MLINEQCVFSVTLMQLFSVLALQNKVKIYDTKYKNVK